MMQYIKEVRPLLKALGPTITGKIDEFVEEYKSALEIMHPFPPAAIPNFLRGLDGQLRKGTSEALTKDKSLAFMDAGARRTARIELTRSGAFLNVPYLPLLRRQCDVIIAVDASADSQRLWFERAQEAADKRALDRWPRIDYRGRFPQDPEGDASSEPESEPSSQDKAADRATGEVTAQAGMVVGDEQSAKAPDTAAAASEPPLTALNIWIGSSTGEETIRMIDVDEERVARTDGIALIYCPLVPGPEVPNPAETWSYVASSRSRADVCSAPGRSSTRASRRMLCSICPRYAALPLAHG